jgi:hypothetical protein
MAIEAVIANQIIDASTVGRNALTAADAAAFRATIGAGTSSFDGVYSSLSGVPSLLPTSGGTLTGSLTLYAATSASPSLNIPLGVTPSSPVRGDLWYAGTGLHFRVSSGTWSVAFRNTNNNFTVMQTFAASTSSVAPLNLPHGTQKTSSLENGDVWTTTVGAFLQINSETQRVAVHAPTQNTYTPASDGTATLLLSATGSNLHKVTRPTTGNITIAFSGETANQSWFLCLETSSTGTPGTVTWPAGLTWLTNAGSPPTVSTAVSKVDSFVFLRTGASTYLAWHTGQN